MDAFEAAFRDFEEHGWLYWSSPAAMHLYHLVVTREAEGVDGDLDDQVLLDWLALRSGLTPRWDSLSGVFDEADLVRVVDGFARVGLGPPLTPRDHFDFLVNAGLIERRIEGGEVRWRAVRPMPLPGERLRLTEEERSREDEARWRRALTPIAHVVLAWVGTRGSSVVESTLATLAHELSLDIETVRAAVGVLEHGWCGWDVMQNVEELDAEERFVLVWAPDDELLLRLIEAEGAGDSFRATLGQLAKDMGLSVEDVRRGLRRLVGDGFIHVVPDVEGLRPDQGFGAASVRDEEET